MTRTTTITMGKTIAKTFTDERRVDLRKENQEKEENEERRREERRRKRGQAICL